MSKVPAAQPDDWERALRGVDLPAARVAIIRDVHENGGIDGEVLNMMERLPKDSYDTLNEVLADVRALYIDDGFDPNALPV